MTTSINDGLELLRGVLENPEAQRGLIMMYRTSQTECTRNGNCGMEVGMSREKDQGAVLKHFLGEEVNLNLHNNRPEDFIVGGEKISAKHSGGKVGTSVKAKWTSADTAAADAIRALINADDACYPSLLITYIDTKKNIITIICIKAEVNRTVIKSLGEKAFVVPRGNSRGINYSSEAMKQLIKNKYFEIVITNAILTGGLDPIQRRIQMLTAAGINPSL